MDTTVVVDQAAKGKGNPSQTNSSANKCTLEEILLGQSFTSDFGGGGSLSPLLFFLNLAGMTGWIITL